MVNIDPQDAVTPTVLSHLVHLHLVVVVSFTSQLSLNRIYLGAGVDSSNLE